MKKEQKLTCLYCQGTEFEVNHLSTKIESNRAFSRYTYTNVSIGTSDSREDEIYAHKCKECDFVMLFSKDKTKQ